MTLDEVLTLLRRECDKAGSQKVWAQAAGVTGAYVSDVLNKRREPGISILDALGLEKCTAYKQKDASLLKAASVSKTQGPAGA